MAVDQRPSSTRERLLESSRDELAPHRSLEAIAEASGRVVGAVSVAAALVSALGLVSATTLTDAGWQWGLPTVLLSAVSVALAVWATVPVEATVTPGDLEDVNRFFSGEIRRRGRIVRTAAVLFGLAVVLTPLPALAAAGTSPERALDVTAGREVDTLKLEVRVEHFPSDAIISVSAGRQVLLEADVNSAGSLATAAEVPSAGGLKRVRVVARAGRKVLADRTVALSR